MLEVLQGICESFIADDEFWLLAGLTDVSFETGDNSRYRHALSTMASAGCPSDLLARLELGVNGNLARICGERCGGLGFIRANLSRRDRERPDLLFASDERGPETIVEVKAVYEMTLPKFYGLAGTHSVADDRDKLLRIRHEGGGQHLFQVIFFLELPNYSYPAGENLMKDGWERWENREYYKKCCGIAAQFNQVRKYLPASSLPKDSPRFRRLATPSRQTAELVERWFTEVFRPADTT